jgi:hypothetical protein
MTAVFKSGWARLDTFSRMTAATMGTFWRLRPVTEMADSSLETRK